MGKKYPRCLLYTSFSIADKKREIKGAVIDSRLVEKDYLFIPVRGEKVDGHSFIPSVFEKGALAVFSEEKLENPAGPYILVENTLDAMKKIAADYRRGLDIKVVGITGSVGKTSTKEMIASVLAQKYNCLLYTSGWICRADFSVKSGKRAEKANCAADTGGV